MRYLFFLGLCLVTSILSGFKSGNPFTLTSEKTDAVIILPASEPECVRLAAADLARDIEKISGKKLKIEAAAPQEPIPAVIIATVGLSDDLLARYDPSAAEIRGKWEAYRVKSLRGNLIITGSDERGTMFGIYRFIEDYLGVDPLYFWSDIAPEKKKVLAWDHIAVAQSSPTFRYRGWFINDEDLLTEWYDSGGIRNIDYPYYGQVVNPEVMEKVVEALVRLRMNLIIPASFIDIRNPAEAKLVETAARRGVFLSMHHVEPMGVSAFTFFNYWKEKTGEKPLFSYYSNREKLEEVWHIYAKEWARYPNVIWQIGLRGIADRPMWLADPGIPQSSEDRGRLISEAMQTQRSIIKEVDKRANPPVTTTLWMEGSALNKEGHLQIPDGTTVVFSDNCPGWKWQDDFYQTERYQANTYGVYYHHQLWGAGPHLAQGVPPYRTYSVFKDAVEKGSTEYAILNVSNIRQFLLGIASSGYMLYNFQNYTPDDFTGNWIANRFSSRNTEIKNLYKKYFEGFVLHDSQKVPMLLDGQTRSFALALLRSLEKEINSPAEFEKETARTRQPAGNTGIKNDPLAISDAHPKPRDNAELLSKAFLQKDSHARTLQEALSISRKLRPEERELLNTNLVSQLQIMIGLEDWLAGVLQAKKSWDSGDREGSKVYIGKALKAFSQIREGQRSHTRGEKWQHWYRGEKKMNLDECERLTGEIATLINKH